MSTLEIVASAEGGRYWEVVRGMRRGARVIVEIAGRHGGSWVCARRRVVVESGRRKIRGERILGISGKNRSSSRGVHFHCQAVTDSGRLQITVSDIRMLMGLASVAGAVGQKGRK